MFPRNLWFYSFLFLLCPVGRKTRDLLWVKVMIFDQKTWNSSTVQSFYSIWIVRWKRDKSVSLQGWGYDSWAPIFSRSFTTEKPQLDMGNLPTSDTCDALCSSLTNLFGFITILFLHRILPHHNRNSSRYLILILIWRTYTR